MLIISEENKKLKGTTYKLPENIRKIFWNIIKNNPPSNNTAYVKAKNVVKNDFVVSMEWLKNMKNYFTKHDNESDPEFIAMGGYVMKAYIDDKLNQLTNSYGRAQHYNSPTKPRQTANNLSGNRGSHSSKSLNISGNLMAGLIPSFESKSKNKILIITEKQFKEIIKNNNNKY